MFFPLPCAFDDAPQLAASSAFREALLLEGDPEHLPQGREGLEALGPDRLVIEAQHTGQGMGGLDAPADLSHNLLVSASGGEKGIVADVKMPGQYQINPDFGLRLEQSNIDFPNGTIGDFSREALFPA